MCCKHCMHSLKKRLQLIVCRSLVDNTPLLSSPSFLACFSFLCAVCIELFFCVVFFFVLLLASRRQTRYFLCDNFLFNVQIFGDRHFKRRQLHSVDCLLQTILWKVNCVSSVQIWLVFHLAGNLQVNWKLQHWLHWNGYINAIEYCCIWLTFGLFRKLLQLDHISMSLWVRNSFSARTQLK